MLAGIVAGVILTIGTDVVLHAIGVFPPWGQSMAGFDGALLLATIFRTVYGTAASYITARLVLVVLAMPQAWAGGTLRVLQLRARPKL